MGHYIVLFPIGLSAFIILGLLIHLMRKKDILFTVASSRRYSNIFNRFIDDVFELDGFSSIKAFYEKNVIKHVDMSFTAYFILKMNVFIVSLIFVYLVLSTNNGIIMEDIYNNPHYKAEVLYSDESNFERTSVESEQKTLSMEIAILEEILNSELDISTMSSSRLKIVIDGMVKQYTWDTDIELVASRVFYRLIDYQSASNIYYRLLFVYAIIAVSVIDAFFIFLSMINDSRRLNELRYIKQQIILIASSSNGNFVELIETIVKRTYFYEKDLRKIIAANRSTSFDTHRVYRDLMQDNDPESKLFFERLMIANFDDFKTAVSEMRQEFANEQKQRERYIAKQKMTIDSIGQIGSIVIMGIGLVKLLLPFIQQFADFQSLL